MGQGTAKHRRRAPHGVRSALASALLLGFTPIFGKQAIAAGLPSAAVVGLRTTAAALLVLLVIGLGRRSLAIYPLGFAGCLLAGVVNGAGSLLYYGGLARLDAGLGQLLYALYPLFVGLLLYLDGQRHGRVVMLALLLSLPAMVLLTHPSRGSVDPTGVGMMVGAGLLYAFHIPINERVLYEVPAPTVAFYTLAGMTAVVLPAWLFLTPWRQPLPPAAWIPLAGLTGVTFLSRLTLFAGVKSIGGMQASILGLAELMVALIAASLWLGETLGPTQIAGGLLLAIALLLTGLDEPREVRNAGRGWLYWLRPPLPSPSPVDRTDTPPQG